MLTEGMLTTGTGTARILLSPSTTTDTTLGRGFTTADTTPGRRFGTALLIACKDDPGRLAVERATEDAGTARILLRPPGIPEATLGKRFDGLLRARGLTDGTLIDGALIEGAETARTLPSWLPNVDARPPTGFATLEMGKLEDRRIDGCTSVGVGIAGLDTPRRVCRLGIDGVLIEGAETARTLASWLAIPDDRAPTGLCIFDTRIGEGTTDGSADVKLPSAGLDTADKLCKPSADGALSDGAETAETLTSWPPSVETRLATEAWRLVAGTMGDAKVGNAGVRLPKGTLDTAGRLCTLGTETAGILPTCSPIVDTTAPTGF